MACARALARAEGRELWDWLTPAGVQPRLPVPHFNVVSGGVHAPNPLDFQEFMIAPVGAPSFPEAVRAGTEVYAALRSLLAGKGHATGLGDEGGFAPQLTSAEMIERYAQITQRFPVWLIEDGLAEDDWDGWAELTARLGERVQLVGDDLFVTNPVIIAEAIGRGVANAALIKVNQVGTVTETLEAMATCRRGGYAQFVSHRSGETTDTFIADLATGSGCGELKTGAPARGERVAKYNRLLEITATQPGLPYGLPGS